MQSAVVHHPVRCSVCKYTERELSERRRKRGDCLTHGRTDGRTLLSCSSAAAAQHKCCIAGDHCYSFAWVFSKENRKVQLNSFFICFCFFLINTNLGKKMDVLPMCSIFQELQIVHDTGYFSALPSLEEYWQQVNISSLLSAALKSLFELVRRSGTELNFTL